MAEQQPMPSKLRHCVQVRLTYDKRTGELWVRGNPRNEDMVRFVLDLAVKGLKDRGARHSLTLPLAKKA